MKRLIGALLLILGLVVPPAQIAEAAPRAKDCAVITLADGRYFTDGVPTAGVTFDTAAPACSKKVKYTLHVLGLDGVPIAVPVSIAGDGVTSEGHRITIPLDSSAPGAVCLRLESTDAKGAVLDSAPVAGGEGDSVECDGAVAYHAPLDAPPGASRMK
ncbi:MAG: hypothetical protein ACRDZU_14515 [Acidimicrobiales bacterium]